MSKKRQVDVRPLPSPDPGQPIRSGDKARPRKGKIRPLPSPMKALELEKGWLRESAPGFIAGLALGVVGMYILLEVLWVLENMCYCA